MSPHNPQVYICPECQTGQLKPDTVSYATWLDEEELLFIPLFSAWICDVCGRVEYDERALELLEALLTGRRRHAPQHPPAGKKNKPSPKV